MNKGQQQWTARKKEVLGRKEITSRVPQTLMSHLHVTLKT